MITGTWRRAADLPLPVRAFAATAYRGSIYVVGGLLEEPHQLLRQPVMRYLSSEDRWEILNDLPWLSIEAGLFVVADTMFVVGGRLNAMGAYDPDADSWDLRPDLPEARDEAAHGAGSGNIYVVGGEAEGGAPAGDSILVYDVASSTWARAGGTPAVRRRGGVAPVLQGRLFVLGGFPMLSTGSTDFSVLNTVATLDLTSHSWSMAPDLPFARFGMAAATLDGRIHVIGGSAFEDDPARPNHVVFDPAAEAWIEAPDIPTPRRDARAVSLGGELYVLGGSERPPFVSDNIYRGTLVEVFRPN